jgi:hypothetical protein
MSNVKRSLHSNLKFKQATRYYVMQAKTAHSGALTTIREQMTFLC